MADFVTASDTKSRAGRRCYRLNLERPFDIHCEQSPLVSSGRSVGVRPASPSRFRAPAPPFFGRPLSHDDDRRPLFPRAVRIKQEYGDYMAPWPGSARPATAGPTEYCPPRHLGGREAVWRELMRWSEAAGRER